MKIPKIEWNIPNILSVLRLFMAAAFVWFYLGNQHSVALGFFLLASLTDLVDGFVARKYNLITDLGKLLDPLADKVLTLSALFCLALTGKIYFWIFWLMLFKELCFVGLALFNLHKKMVVYSKFLGKVTTVLFFCGILAHLVGWSVAGNILVYTGLVTAFFTAVQYFLIFVKSKNYDS